MSVYKNPKDGSTLSQMPKIATNIEMVDAPQELYVTQEELVEAVSPKQDIIQYTTLPTASEDELDKIYQYIGETTVDYINGRFYKCVSNGEVVPTYSWQEVSFGGGVSNYEDLTNQPQINSVTLVGDKSASDLGLQAEMQLSTIPTASIDYLNKIVQYIGTNTPNYINGYFYKCVSDGAVTPTYSWERINVQPNGGSGGALADLSDVDIDVPTNGQILKYNSATTKWENAEETTGTYVTEADLAQLEIINDFSIYDSTNSVNIMNYGAVGDGVTDDSTAFINAVTEAISSSKPVILPKGKYNLNHVEMNSKAGSEYLLFTAYVEIIGESREYVEILNSNISAQYGISVDSVTFDGGTTRYFTSEDGYYGFPASINNKVVALVATPLANTDNINVYYKNCKFINVDMGSVAYYSKENYQGDTVPHTIDNNIIENCIFQDIGNIAVFHSVAIHTGRYFHNTFKNIGSEEITTGYSVGLRVGDTSNNSTQKVDDCIIARNLFDTLKTGYVFSYDKHDLVGNFIQVNAITSIIDGNNCKNITGYGDDREAIYTKGVNVEVCNNYVENGGTGEGYICCKGLQDASDYSTQKYMSIHNNIIRGYMGRGIAVYGGGNVYDNFIEISRCGYGIKGWGLSASIREISIHDNILKLGIGTIHLNDANHTMIIPCNTSTKHAAPYDNATTYTDEGHQDKVIEQTQPPIDTEQYILGVHVYNNTVVVTRYITDVDVSDNPIVVDAPQAVYKSTKTICDVEVSSNIFTTPEPNDCAIAGQTSHNNIAINFSSDANLSNTKNIVQLNIENNILSSAMGLISIPLHQSRPSSLEKCNCIIRNNYFRGLYETTNYCVNYHSGGDYRYIDTLVYESTQKADYFGNGKYHVLSYARNVYTSDARYVLIETISNKKSSCITTGNASILYYEMMPELETLFSLPNNTVFETGGYNSATDGNGGLYKISTTAQGISVKKTLNNSDRYLILLNQKRGANTYFINVGRLGIQSRAATGAIQTEANAKARENSDIIDNISFGTNKKVVLYFPTGIYNFDRPIDFSSNNFTIKGEHVSTSKDVMYTSGNRYGTILCFPYLTYNQRGIILGDGDIEDVIIQGNPNAYNFVVDRSKVVDSATQSQVITETIGTQSGTYTRVTNPSENPQTAGYYERNANYGVSTFTYTATTDEEVVSGKVYYSKTNNTSHNMECVGLEVRGNGTIKDVTIQNFYQGLQLQQTYDRYINNLYISRCHYGVSNKDTTACNNYKFQGVYGTYVHTLIKLLGSSISINQARVSDCVHAIDLGTGDGYSITDLDGDWCTEALVYVSGDVTNSTFLGIGGTCCTLKNTTSGAVDVTSLTNTTGYGIIEVASDGSFIGNNVILKSLDHKKVVDSDSTHLTPNILLVFSGTPSITNNKFDVANPQQYNSSASITQNTDWTKIIQLGNNVSGRIDTFQDTFYFNSGNVNTFKTMLQYIVANSADYATFQTNIANL